MKHKRDPEKQKHIDAHVPVDKFTSSNIRSMGRLGVATAMPYMISVAKGEHPDASPDTSIRACHYLYKVGMGEQPSTIHIERRQWLTPICELAAKHFKDHASYDAWCNEILAALEHMQ